MPACAVYGCNNYTKAKIKQMVRFYSFPKNAIYKAKWVKACARKDKFNVANATICSAHFASSCFVKSLQNQLLGISPKKCRNISDDALPTENLPIVTADNASDNSLLRMERMAVRQRKEVVRNILADQIEREGDVGESSTAYIHEEISSSSISEPTPSIEESLSILLEEKKGWEKDRKKFPEKIEELNSEVKSLKRALGKVFTKGQIKALITEKKVNWNEDDITNAISIRSISPKCYEFLRLKLNFPWPSTSTLKRWALALNCNEGILVDVLSVMKSKRPLFTEIESLAALCFDEMKVSQLLCYDSSLERIIGPHGNVQVLMARGLIGKWRQPIYYNFDEKMTMKLLQSIISSLEQCGYPVMSITCDLAGGNRSLWKDLNISLDRSSFLNPFDNSRCVYVFADAPHLLKLARNHFVDSGFNIENNLVDKSSIQNLLDICHGSELRVAYKVTQYHLDVRGFERQKVKLAAQFFSDSLSKALVWCGERKLIGAQWEKASALIKLFNDWFDVMNSYCPFNNSNILKGGYGNNLEEQNMVLTKMTNLISCMRVKGKNFMLPFQYGICISNTSVKGLLDYLVERYQIKCILTSRLNQDVLENFFSYVRGMGRTYDHPLPVDFKNRLKWYILGKHSQVVFQNGRNTVANENESCLTVSKEQESLDSELSAAVNQFFHLFEDETGEPVEGDEEWLRMVEVEDIRSGNVSRMPEQDVSQAGLKYVAGFVAHKFRATYKTLGSLASLLPQEGITDWVNLLSRGGLMSPSDVWLSAAQIIEEVFQSYHGETFKVGKNIVSEVTGLAVPKVSPEIPLAAVKMYVKTRTYIRVREINKALKASNGTEKRNLIAKLKKLK